MAGPSLDARWLVALHDGRPTEVIHDMQRRGTLSLMLLAFGCVEHGATIVDEPPGTVACRRGPECDAKWRRALAWVRALCANEGETAGWR